MMTERWQSQNREERERQRKMREQGSEKKK